MKICLTVLAFFVGFLFSFAITTTNASFAQSLDDIQKDIQKYESKKESKENEIDRVRKKADGITNEINNLSGKLNITQSQINSLQAQISDLVKDIENLDKKLKLKNEELNTQKKIKNITLRTLYINARRSLFELLLSKNSLSESVQSTAYIRQFMDDSENLVSSINNSITKYESDKKEIAEIKKQVEKQKKDLQSVANNLLSQVNNNKGELAAVSQKKVALQQDIKEINKKLNELSAKQKALLQEKTETFNTSVGDVPTTGDSHASTNYDPGFRKAFAAFSFGAPHRKGLSQYGAKGRAKEGQNYEKILKDYYGNIDIVKPDLPKNIKTSAGTMKLDGRYLKGIAEMPASWPMEALKAQAIAARTYALSYVGWRANNTVPNGSICTSESCQVWSSSKATSGSAKRWHQAVDETKGKVMIGKETGEIFSAWYAASSGGYNYKYTSLGHTTKGGWDTKCDSKDCWTSDAFESIAGSPWFYKGWYKSRHGKTCGRSHPWLTEKEFADIIGALVLYKDNSDNQTHLSQPDAKSCWGKDINDTWSRDEIREKSGIKTIDSVDVSYSSGGVTAEVKVKTNKGEYKFSGEDFKAIFNLRAPGVIHLKSMLFNIEVKN